MLGPGAVVRHMHAGTGCRECVHSPESVPDCPRHELCKGCEVPDLQISEGLHKPPHIRIRNLHVLPLLKKVTERVLCAQETQLQLVVTTEAGEVF